MYKFSKRSLQRLAGVEQKLAAVYHRAIELSPLDFGISCGLRTLEEQKRLVADGKSQTMKSRHLPNSRGLSEAVDIYVLKDGQAVWDILSFIGVTEAIRSAAIELGCPIRWGAAWHVDLRDAESALDAYESYVDLRRAQGRKPFIDSPHCEMLK